LTAVAVISPELRRVISKLNMWRQCAIFRLRSVTAAENNVRGGVGLINLYKLQPGRDRLLQDCSKTAYSAEILASGKILKMLTIHSTSKRP